MAKKNQQQEQEQQEVVATEEEEVVDGSSLPQSWNHYGGGDDVGLSSEDGVSCSYICFLIDGTHGGSPFTRLFRLGNELYEDANTKQALDIEEVTNVVGWEEGDHGAVWCALLLLIAARCTCRIQIQERRDTAIPVG
ncbi:hypothetical protein AMTR_s00036p00020620 [Amborella trichopoda]|uniref:Uncharacterized protein n=1 Tax=Amborella trichopoda TaxID=13333 RepID=U5CQ28_AMBTC|nr:hypothetical protein AMTR_s00036p00020620 [Amborella trichopoda]